MITAAVTMMRNEQDVCAQVVRHLFTEGVDHVLVADNRSTDRTREILEGLGDGRLLVVDDPDPVYDQGAKMTRLAHRAHELWGADWIVPFDADELWCGARWTLAEALRDADEAGCDAATADAWDMVPQPGDDAADPDPFTRIRCRRGPMPEYKTAFRWEPYRIVSPGNHVITPPPVRPARSALTIRHYGVRTIEQARAKFRHGATVLPPWWPQGAGVHWRELGAKDDDAFAAWWEGYCGLPVDPG